MSNDSKYLVLKACAGLGNRLHTVSAAIDYAQKTRRKLVIDWSEGLFGPKGKNIFHEYFELEGVDLVKNLTDIPNYQSLSFYPEIWKLHPEFGIYDVFLSARHPFFDKIPSRMLVSERLKMLQTFWLTLEKKKVPTKPFAFFKEIFDKRNIPLGHNLSFSHKEDVLFYIDFLPPMNVATFHKHLRLKKEITKKIESFTVQNQLHKNTIGIHVRFAEKKPDKDISILFAKIDSLNIPDKRIYLATDSNIISKLFKERYQTVIEYPVLRPDVEGHGIHHWKEDFKKDDLGQRILEDGITDMWLLSRCEFLLYQGNSSFSKISATLHQNKKNVYDWTQI